MSLEFPYRLHISKGNAQAIVENLSDLQFPMPEQPDLQAHDTSTTRSLGTMAIQQTFMRALCCILGVLPLRKTILGENISREIGITITVTSGATARGLTGAHR